MPQVPIIMPQLGESIAEATIVDVKVKPGDEVVADQEIIEVETNKAVMGVTTPCKGKIDKITVQLKETYQLAQCPATWKRARQTPRDSRSERHPLRNGKSPRKFRRGLIKKSLLHAREKSRHVVGTAKARALATCPFLRLRRAQLSCRRASAHAWPSCN